MHEGARRLMAFAERPALWCLMAEWFAAKTVYRRWVEGSFIAPDTDVLEELPTHVLEEEFDEVSVRAATVVEERVVLFRAENADEAIALAEREAEEYSSGGAFNVFGQHIATRVLKYVECYRLDSAPSDRGEVFSRTSLCNSSIEDEQVLDKVVPLDDCPPHLREAFVPNLSQTVRRRS